MENTKGIIFNKEFDELFQDNTKIALVKTLEMCISFFKVSIQEATDMITESEDKFGDLAEFVTMCNVGMQAVEKQVPKKVIKIYILRDLIFGECPNCGHTGLAENAHEHCWWCGQKLDWRKYNAEQKTE